MAKTDQFVAASLLFLSGLMLLYPWKVSSPQLQLMVTSAALLGVFAGILNLLRVAYMRNAAGLRACSIVANVILVAFVLCDRVLLLDELGLAQFVSASIALMISLVHRPPLRINGLGRFKYRAGG